MTKRYDPRFFFFRLCVNAIYDRCCRSDAAAATWGCLSQKRESKRTTIPKLQEKKIIIILPSPFFNVRLKPHEVLLLSAMARRESEPASPLFFFFLFIYSRSLIYYHNWGFSPSVKGDCGLGHFALTGTHRQRRGKTTTELELVQLLRAPGRTCSAHFLLSFILFFFFLFFDLYFEAVLPQHTNNPLGCSGP